MTPRDIALTVNRWYSTIIISYQRSLTSQDYEQLRKNCIATRGAITDMESRYFSNRQEMLDNLQNILNQIEKKALQIAKSAVNNPVKYTFFQRIAIVWNNWWLRKKPVIAFLKNFNMLFHQAKKFQDESAYAKAYQFFRLAEKMARERVMTNSAVRLSCLCQAIELQIGLLQKMGLDDRATFKIYQQKVEDNCATAKQLIRIDSTEGLSCYVTALSHWVEFRECRNEDKLKFYWLRSIQNKQQNNPQWKKDLNEVIRILRCLKSQKYYGAKPAISSPPFLLTIPACLDVFSTNRLEAAVVRGDIDILIEKCEFFHKEKNVEKETQYVEEKQSTSVVSYVVANALPISPDSKELKDASVKEVQSTAASPSPSLVPKVGVDPQAKEEKKKHTEEQQAEKARIKAEKKEAKKKEEQERKEKEREEQEKARKQEADRQARRREKEEKERAIAAEAEIVAEEKRQREELRRLEAAAKKKEKQEQLEKRLADERKEEEKAAAEAEKQKKQANNEKNRQKKLKRAKEAADSAKRTAQLRVEDVRKTQVKRAAEATRKALLRKTEIIRKMDEAERIHKEAEEKAEQEWKAAAEVAQRAVQAQKEAEEKAEHERKAAEALKMAAEAKERQEKIENKKRILSQGAFVCLGALPLPAEVKNYLDRLEAVAPEEVSLLVGGLPRDHLIHRVTSKMDIDLVTSASLEQVTQAFPEAKSVVPHYDTLGQLDYCIVELSGQPAAQICFRKGLRDLCDDACQRDATINALYRRRDGVFLDPLGQGYNDLCTRIIRPIRPQERNAEEKDDTDALLSFKRDPIRIPRMIDLYHKLKSFSFYSRSEIEEAITKGGQYLMEMKIPTDRIRSCIAKTFINARETDGGFFDFSLFNLLQPSIPTVNIKAEHGRIFATQVLFTSPVPAAPPAIPATNFTLAS